MLMYRNNPCWEDLMVVMDVLREWKLVLSSSAIAAFIGFLPGLGSTVSTWICYSWSMIISKNKSGFGKGDFRGVIGCEAANNASAGGAMIPTIAFGVPGSTVTALVLVVFWAVGINPGPKLLTDHLDLVYLIVWSIALANIIGAAICYLCDQQIGHAHQSSGPYFSPLGVDRACCRYPVCYGFCRRYRFTHCIRDSRMVHEVSRMASTGPSAGIYPGPAH